MLGSAWLLTYTYITFFSLVLIVRMTFQFLFSDSFVPINGSELRKEKRSINFGVLSNSKTNVIFRKSLKFCFCKKRKVTSVVVFLS